MRAINTVSISNKEVTTLLAMHEGHFCDLKAIEITPAKLTRTISAFANAEGGEVFVGVDEDRSTRVFSWRGFPVPEDANGHIQHLDSLFPLGTDYHYDFLTNPSQPGYILRIQVQKTRDVTVAADGVVYIRRGAQNLAITDPDRLSSLKRDKGLTSFENEPVACHHSLVTNSEQIIRFILEVVPTAEPEDWLRKQQLLVDGKPTVAAVILFADEPQAILPKRSGIKLYRYRTDAEGSRDTLDSDPISIEGCAYDQIETAVRMTQSIIESVRVRSPQGLESVAYPTAAIHEIITNAVLHRDYAIADDIHVRIFENRVEVLSPGTLPGHVTPQNILRERFARNPTVVRLINKFPNPPNKDVGEGLNTAFEAMRHMRLKAPLIDQQGGYVTVTLRHESLASPEETILEYLQTHDEIANRQARAICHIGSENTMKNHLTRMVHDGLIERIPGRTGFKAAYRLPIEDRTDSSKP